MSEGRHTPGPWVSFRDEEDRFDDDQIIITTEDRMRSNMVPIAKVSVEFFEPFDSEQYANARVCAAAPEMLAALKAAFYQIVGLELASKVAEHGWQWPEDAPRHVHLTAEEVRAAIAKAEGRSPSPIKG